jgi:glycosyltransferase involved in cell wall biosynthesis
MTEGNGVHLIGLVDGLEHVCCRYRLAAYRPELEAAGHELRLAVIPRQPWKWISLAAQLQKADAVIWLRKLPAPWQLFWLRRKSRYLVFDFDDALFLRDSYSPKGLHSTNRLMRFAALVRASDRVVAGNEFLRRQAACWSDPGRVSVIPTCVDVASYPSAAHCRQGAGVQLVWIGSSSTLRGLERARPLIDAAGGRVTGLKLKIIADRFMAFEHVGIIERLWSAETERSELAAADIGISWVPDDLWSRGKCGLKVLQYMAAGLPVVANPVGVQSEIVRHGETGFLAETPDQWADAIEQLAASPSLRRHLGAAGRRLALERFDKRKGAERWVELLARPGRWREAA